MDSSDFLKALDRQSAANSQNTKEQQRQQFTVANTQAVIDSIGVAVKSLMAFQAQHQPKVSVTNQKLPTSISTPDVQLVVDALENLKQPIQDNKLDDTKIIDALNQLNDSITKLPTEFPQLPEPIEEVTVKNQPDYTKQFDSLGKAIRSIDVKPVVNIPEDKPDDYTPVLDSLSNVVQAVRAIKIPKPAVTDLTPLVEATTAVQTTIENLKFPVANYVLPFKDSTGKATQVQLDSNGNIPTASSGGASLPTSPKYGQVKVSVTNTAVQLTSNVLTVGVIVQALLGNVGNVVIGDSSVTTSNGFQLQPGQATSAALLNVNGLYINGTSGDGVCFLGS